MIPAMKTAAGFAARRGALLSSLALSRQRAAMALSIGAVAAIFGFWRGPVLGLEGVPLAFGLAWASIVDIDRQKLPNAITLSLIAVGLAIGCSISIAEGAKHAAAAMASYAIIWLIRYVYLARRGLEAMGLGDAKLLAVAGAWVGTTELPMVLAGAAGGALAFVCVLGVMKRSAPAEQIAFGPYLAGAIWLAWVLS